jgi:DNA-binding NarL/FixJ family response regulator
MRVVLVGSPRERDRLRRAVFATAWEVVGEASTLDAARARGIPADAFVVAPADHNDEDEDEDDAMTGAESLTARELDVLRLLAEGLPNKAIATRLGISDQTVKFHVASIGGKLGARNRTDAVRLAIRRGLIEI